MNSPRVVWSRSRLGIPELSEEKVSSRCICAATVDVLRRLTVCAALREERWSWTRAGTEDLVCFRRESVGDSLDGVEEIRLGLS